MNLVGAAIVERNLTSITLLPFKNARDVHGKVISNFCNYVPGIELKIWLWEYYIARSKSSMSDNGIDDLMASIPQSQQCFMLLESDGVELPFWIYGGRTDEMVNLLGNLPRLEYYIVDNHFRWLVSENHHNVLSVIYLSE